MNSLRPSRKLHEYYKKIARTDSHIAGGCAEIRGTPILKNWAAKQIHAYLSGKLHSNYSLYLVSWHQRIIWASDHLRPKRNECQWGVGRSPLCQLGRLVAKKISRPGGLLRLNRDFNTTEYFSGLRFKVMRSLLGNSFVSAPMIQVFYETIYIGINSEIMWSISLLVMEHNIFLFAIQDRR